jgi:hypothetical protein
MGETILPWKMKQNAFWLKFSYNGWTPLNGINGIYQNGQNGDSN